MKFWDNVGIRTLNKWLNFGGDTEHRMELCQ